MSWLSKKSRTRFIRDSTGKVIAVEQEEDSNNRTVFDRSATERYSRKQARQKERQERRYENRYQREQERQAYRKAFNESRVKRKAEMGHRAGQAAFGRIIPPRQVVHVHAGKKQFQKQQQKKKKQLSPDQWANTMMKKMGW
jgi:hypothetical protein